MWYRVEHRTGEVEQFPSEHAVTAMLVARYGEDVVTIDFNGGFDAWRTEADAVDEARAVARVWEER